ncbi:hypothetical protein NPIL_499411 [Nephila pilipes]|uniref:Uncharacterized protein n=1 Tax=Nephila pilipes TaxID=299642 RepID=A0A8X6TZN1_NEPPI|nr:hypothetical protein NPIL_499411 [Nephila pilipes]
MHTHLNKLPLKDPFSRGHLHTTKVETKTGGVQVLRTPVSEVVFSVSNARFPSLSRLSIELPSNVPWDLSKYLLAHYTTFCLNTWPQEERASHMLHLVMDGLQVCRKS